MEKILNMKEVRQLLGVSTRTIQNWDKDGKESKNDSKK